MGSCQIATLENNSPYSLSSIYIALNCSARLKSNQFNFLLHSFRIAKKLLINTINQTSFKKRYFDFKGAAVVFKWLSSKLNHQQLYFQYFSHFYIYKPIEKTLSANSKGILKNFTTPYRPIRRLRCKALCGGGGDQSDIKLLCWENPQTNWWNNSWLNVHACLFRRCQKHL